jgi:hypothetical protein
MQLSYLSRLICMALASAGLLLLVTEALAWLVAPRLLASTLSVDARRSERNLFVLAVSARLLPWIIACGVLLPAYMRGEENRSGERVGLFCIAAAAGLLAATVLCASRACAAWLWTQRCRSLCNEAGARPNGLPLLIHPSERPLLAVAGLFRPRIMVSRCMLDSRRFSPASMEIAFGHESAHAASHDNLKLLLLSMLPGLPLGTRTRPSAAQLWRLAAEMAADEAGSRGRRDRSILLAELLVKLARERSHPTPQGSFALLSRSEDLRLRVDRLLQERPLGQEQRKRKLLPSLALAAGLMIGLILCLVCARHGHRAAETLLHLACEATTGNHELT